MSNDLADHNSIDFFFISFFPWFHHLAEIPKRSKKIVYRLKNASFPIEQTISQYSQPDFMQYPINQVNESFRFTKERYNIHYILHHHGRADTLMVTA